MPAAAFYRLATLATILLAAMLQISASSSSDHIAAVAPPRNQSADETRRSLSSSSSQLQRNRRLLLGTDRISDECTKADISILQGRSSPLPNGIPTYTVQIINLCVVGCPLSNIHVSCGWFASAKLVNPKTFRRLGFNDCLVNDGKAVKGGESVFFHYANSFQYPMKVESAVACSGV